MSTKTAARAPSAVNRGDADGAKKPATTVTSTGLPVRDSVLALTHVLSNQIGRVFDGEIEAKFGLSHAEWRVMLTVASSPGATSVEIIDAWAMDKMAVSRAVARLEKRKFVRRKQVKRDRRRFGLTLTALGRKAYDRILPHAMARHREFLSCLTPAEQAQLRQALQKLNAQAQRLTQLPGPVAD